MATTPKTVGSYAQKGAMIQARDQHLEIKALKMPQHIQIVGPNTPVPYPMLSLMASLSYPAKSSGSATLQCVLEYRRLWSRNPNSFSYYIKQLLSRPIPI